MEEKKLASLYAMTTKDLAKIRDLSSWSMSVRRFFYVAVISVIYTLLVVLFGAYVRLSFSGAGCGKHWPTCQGEMLEMIPVPTKMETWIELFHRLSSALSVVITTGLALFSIKLFPRGHIARRAALWALVFMIGEALLGAALVLFEHVAHNPSMKRAFSMSLHLANTFFLLAMFVKTAEASSGPIEEVMARCYAPLFPRRLPAKVKWTLVLLVLLGMTGAVAALGDTIYPSMSLKQGFEQDVHHGSPLLLKLRAIHPLFALFVALMTYLSTQKRYDETRPPVLVNGLMKEQARYELPRVMVRLCLFLQLGLGLLNLAWLAPPALQLAHLLVADLLWISFVLFVSKASEEHDLIFPSAESELRATTNHA